MSDLVEQKPKRELMGFDKLQELYSKTTTEELSKLSDDDLMYIKDEAQIMYNFFNNMQLATKLLCNAIYGGLGTPKLRYYNFEVANDITAEGREVCKLMDKTTNLYFKKVWTTDYDWHRTLAEKFPLFFENITIGEPIKVSDNSKDFVIYADTDSVKGDTIIKNNLGEKTIEEIFNEASRSFTNKQSGTEYRVTDLKILNVTNNRGVDFEQPLFVSRHKVFKKEQYKIVSKSGKSVNVTGDHCLVVFRNGEKIKCKPSEVLKGDKILVRKNIYDYELEDFEVIKLEDFDDEYVYDFTMKNDTNISEDTQTFVANDILIHNSNYVVFDYVFDTLKLNPYTLPTKETSDFITFFMREKLDPIYDDILTKFIGGRNGKNNMIFELEAVGGFGIWVAKKKYVFAKLWEDGKYIADKGSLKVVGLEIKQKSASKRVKDILKVFVNTIFVRRGKLDSQTFFQMCNSVRKNLQDATVDELAKATKLNNYNKYILFEDENKIEYAPRTPMTVRGASRYNQFIRKNKLESIYPILKDDMFVKVFYDETGLPFTYPADYECPPNAPKISVDIQLEKLVFAPVKRLVDGMIDGDLSSMGRDKVQMGFKKLMNKFK